MLNIGILSLILAVSILSIYAFMRLSAKNYTGTKGITKEYVSQSGIKRTARKDREDFIV